MPRKSPEFSQDLAAGTLPQTRHLGGPAPSGLNREGPRLTGLGPMVDERTRLLVLGSFPGVASLQAAQYYAHPRNQFWPIVGTLLGWDWRELSYAQRLQAACDSGLGIWDTYAACQRQGSLDSAIRQPEFNDFASLLPWLPALAGIAHNGAESARARRYTASFGVPVFQLPSTSPANASWSLERKLAAWREVFATCGLI
jgi:hypoxanthine-DNA glycosylase